MFLFTLLVAFYCWLYLLVIVHTNYGMFMKQTTIVSEFASCANDHTLVLIIFIKTALPFCSYPKFRNCLIGIYFIILCSILFFTFNAIYNLAIIHAHIVSLKLNGWLTWRSQHKRNISALLSCLSWVRSPRANGTDDGSMLLNQTQGII